MRIHKKYGRVFAWLLLICLMFAALSGCGGVEITIENVPGSGDDYSVQEDGKSASGSSKLEIHFLDVGQGDSTLITCDGHSMLIDAGKNDWGTEIQSYLESKGIKKLDYAIGTHPDADHIGGLDVILYKFGAGSVFMPEFAKDTKTYDDVVQVIKNKNLKRLQPKVGKTYTLGGAKFTVIAPNAEYGDQANDYSVGILLTHGKKKFLFTGDAEEDSEADIVKNGISLKADVYKVAHHGSKTASTEALMEAVQPEYAVISVGEGNRYGHPHAEVLNRLRSMGVKVFRTDEQGTIVLKSDGRKITWNASPSDSWKAGEPGSSSSLSGDSSGKTTYYINTNTKKFHTASCRYAPEPKADNCEKSTETISALKKKGYIPCGHCIEE
ncbi:MAG: ComEC/Rec2 family competence protein [Lachnospiraceae bacterium]|nr:ComEC/Rec2 family competence protein [Lachnospiraceae bacterium]